MLSTKAKKYQVGFSIFYESTIVRQANYEGAYLVGPIGKRGSFSKRICHSLVTREVSRKVTLTIYRILIIVTIHFHNGYCNRTEKFTGNPHAW